MLNTNGNVFGGFSPVKWECDSNRMWKSGDSLRRFLFTLRNPHGVHPRKFGLRAEKKECATTRSSQCGPSFYGCVMVRNNCSTSSDSCTYISTN
jgi:hypothetical protein